MNISIETLHQLLTCNPENGTLTWRQRPQTFFACYGDWAKWNTRYAGKPAFTAQLNGGYHVGALFDVNYRAHRVIWALHYGEWPQFDIDHINGNPSDNRIVNLRDVSHSENLMNCKLSKANTSGQTGVWWRADRNKWYAYVTFNKKRKSLGLFETKEEAILARQKANIEYGFHENHGRKAA